MENNKLTLEQLRTKGTAIQFSDKEVKVNCKWWGSDYNHYKRFYNANIVSFGADIRNGQECINVESENYTRDGYWQIYISEFKRLGLLQETIYSKEYCKANKVAIRINNIREGNTILHILNTDKHEKHWSGYFDEKVKWYIRLNDDKYSFTINSHDFIYSKGYEIIDFQTFIEHNKQETMEKFKIGDRLVGKQKCLKDKNGHNFNIFKPTYVRPIKDIDGEFIQFQGDHMTWFYAKDFKLENEETMEGKKIIGYKVKEQYLSSVRLLLPSLTSLGSNNVDFTINSDFFPIFKNADVLDLWFNTVYEEEYKVGDYVYVLKYICEGAEVDSVIKITNVGKTNNWTGGQNVKTQRTLGFYTDRAVGHYRKATPEEIKAAQTITVSMGEFNVVVKDGKCYHNSDDITTFVKELVETFRTFKRTANTRFGSYYAIIGEITFSKTGCQSNTKFSAWENLYNVWESNK